METFRADIRYGLRSLSQKPGVTAAALLTLAFGIGANTAIFSVVNAALLRPLPYPDPEELVMVWQDHTRLDGPATEWASPDNFFDWRDRNAVFDGMFAFGGFAPTLTGDGEPEQLQGAVVSHDALSILGVEPLLGRSFRPDEDRAGAERVVLLSHSLWQRHFSSDPAVLGRAITLDEKPAVIVGVLAPEPAFPVLDSPELFAPLGIDPSNSCGRGCVTLRVIARMKEGMTLERARADMLSIAARLERDYPEDNRGVGTSVVLLHEQLVSFIRPALVLLFAAVGLVLAMACANVASLVLARAFDREREVATRVAMGASRGRLLRQFLTENMMLALLGSGLGMVVALWGVDALRGFVSPDVARLSQVRVDGRVLLFTSAIAVLTGLVFGLAPALRASKRNLSSSLKEGSRGLTASRTLRMRSALVVVQVALALAILVGASLLARSFSALTRVDPGFDPANVLTGTLGLSAARYDEPVNRVAFVDRLLDRVLALPSVTGAAVVNALPLGGADGDAGFLIEGREPPEPNRSPVAWYRSVSPGYFSTMRMRLVRGRFLEEGDDPSAPPVVLINETSARRYWPDEDPLLARVRIGGEWRRVVGVVADTKHFGLAADDRPALYFPYAQVPLRGLGLVVRGARPPEELTTAVREAVRELDPELPLGGVAMLADAVSENVSTPRMTTLLFALFGFLGLGLAAVGLYGVLSETVAQSRREIGIRMALGARAEDVRRAVVLRGILLLVLGSVLGLGAAGLLSRLLEALLYGVAPGDPIAFLSAAVVLSAVAAVSSYLPARRASRVDPIVALRYE